MIEATQTFNGTHRVFREFDTVQEARDYRHANGTGGWIFEPEDGGNSILFPPEMPPIDIFNHLVTKGRCGRLIGCQ